MMRTKLGNIRRLIERVLSEEAASVSQAEKRGLALYTNESSGGTYYVLYDPQKLEDLAKKKLAIDACIVAMMITQKPGDAWGASEVKNSAADKGWGPLLYDIVMSMEGGLMSDRDKVSSHAQKVWSHYKNKRNDVDAKILDDTLNPRTEDEFDDAYVKSKLVDGTSQVDKDNPLNYAYFVKNKPNVGELQMNNYDALKSSGVSGSDLEDAAAMMFGDRYEAGWFQ